MGRFLQNNDVVLDTRTGLMWPRNASLSDFPMAWTEALAFVKNLNRSRFQGHADWKLPNRRELFSLVSHETINPSLPAAHPFVNVFNGYYWTSTSCARLPDQAWYIHLGGARVFKGMKYNSYLVWPVRLADTAGARVFETGQQRCYDESGDPIDCRGTGQDGELCRTPLEGSRFTQREDLIDDRMTGLTWLKDADINGEVVDWKTALDGVRKMNQTGAQEYSDWRVPDILELESLTDMGRHSPALPRRHPFVNVREFYWSATPSAYDTRYAWALYARDGVVGVGYKPLKEFYLWPVRGRSLRLNSD
jgi:hypothetical protein